MKIIYKEGNLLDSTEIYLAHGCNCQGKMGKGVALQIKTKYPKAYHDYINMLPTSKLGDVLISNVGTLIEEKIIFNCLTQYDYNKNPNIQNVSYDAIRQSMININNYMVYNKLNNEFVAMPKIGSSLGGGDWDIISKIIEDESIQFQPVAYELKDK